MRDPTKSCGSYLKGIIYFDSKVSQFNCYISELTLLCTMKVLILGVYSIYLKNEQSNPRTQTHLSIIFFYQFLLLKIDP